MPHYCPYCGCIQLYSNTRCADCAKTTTMVETEHDLEYYREKSIEKYGDPYHYKEFILPEMRANPLFDERLYYNPPISFINPKVANQPAKISKNVPKCPTCGSTNIAKISVTKRAVHGAVFGLFSSTARSQMQCKSCGYRW